MSDEDMALMSDLWAEGCKAKEIADIVGYSVGWVCQLIHYRRDLFPYRQRRRPDSERRKWARLVVDGRIGQKMAAHKAGVHVNTMRNWVSLYKEGRL